MVSAHRIAVLPGDGVGPEVVDATLTVLDAVQTADNDLKLEFVTAEAGANCIPKYGTNLPRKTMDILRKTDACLKGPMTTPEEPGSPVSVAVTIRKAFDLYANVRPCKSLPNVWCIHPDIDLVILRENTEGLYSGKEMEITPGVGVALRVITRQACEKIARFGFKLAMKREKHLSYVHKGNVLKLTDGIFKEAVLTLAKEFPNVKLDEMHIDAVTMQLIKRPEFFDVIVTTNMFGDILSDEAAQIVGGLGFSAGANIGERYGMFEPVHGSAPKYTGQNKVNPIACIFAGKMMMEFLEETSAAQRIEKGVVEVMKEKKVLTYDLRGNSTTSEMAEAIASKIRSGR